MTIQNREREEAMPFVNIQILKGHPQERMDEMARRVTAAISELAVLPPEAIWVVFDEVAAEDWYVGSTRVSELKKRAANK
jgi:4-oxalocrotonate tautomerase